jgi:hypothetical protein
MVKDKGQIKKEIKIRNENQLGNHPLKGAEMNQMIQKDPVNKSFLGNINRNYAHFQI